MTEPTALTFEAGYTRLQTISQRVTSEEVPVAEMCDLFAEGKGLQKALTEYLDDQKSRVEAIERGRASRPSASLRRQPRPAPRRPSPLMPTTSRRHRPRGPRRLTMTSRSSRSRPGSHLRSSR